jgi:hypothetical protein
MPTISGLKLTELPRQTRPYHTSSTDPKKPTTIQTKKGLLHDCGLRWEKDRRGTEVTATCQPLVFNVTDLDRAKLAFSVSLALRGDRKSTPGPFAESGGLQLFDR